MSIHEQHNGPLNDEKFFQGALKYLVTGNKCRLLDGRRTPGTIETVCYESAMFRFRIDAFEDKGKCWELPAEDVVRFQFYPGSEELPHKYIHILRERIIEFQKSLDMSVDHSEKSLTTDKLRLLVEEAKSWLRSSSALFSDRGRISSIARSKNLLAEDLVKYMAEKGLLELEQRTARAIVLNPYSGEWIKGMRIVMAVLSILPYRGMVPRTCDIFDGIGRKELREEYILNRLAFVRAAFALSDIKEVVLYRGMSTESQWRGRKEGSLTSWTFKRKVAEAFTDMRKNSRFINSYLIKRTFPVEKLFITFVETAEMNEQYLEAEALVLTDNQDNILW